MHNPERWAILQFSTNNDPSTAATPFEYYDEWPARAAAVSVGSEGVGWVDRV
jgi:hypothetical protein